MTRESGGHRVLSSQNTFEKKYIVVPLWITVFGAGTILQFFIDFGGPAFLKFAFLVVWVVGTIVLLKAARPLVMVTLVGDNLLLLRSYRKQEFVPLTEMANLSEDFPVNLIGHVVVLTFRRPTAFGTSVTFIPAGQRLLSKVPELISELRRLIDAANAGRNSQAEN